MSPATVLPPAGQQPGPVAAGLPESRVLIIGTGGTICMQEGPDGLQPSSNFLESAMAPRPTFNDQSGPSGKSFAAPNPALLSARRRPRR